MLDNERLPSTGRCNFAHCQRAVSIPPLTRTTVTRHRWKVTRNCHRTNETAVKGAFPPGGKPSKPSEPAKSTKRCRWRRRAHQRKRRSAAANRGQSLEIQSLHLRPDEGRELAFPKSSEVQTSGAARNSSMSADVGDATPLEGDEKLPNVVGLQLLIVQEPSLERDARNDVFPPVVPSTK